MLVSIRIFIITFVTIITITISPPSFGIDEPKEKASVTRGFYLARISGCISCHTDTNKNAQILGGGREILSPYGSFYSPNITIDFEEGIGNWSDQDFINAVRYGIRPDGKFYYPVFPYNSYKMMNDSDILDIKAWINTQNAVSLENKPHEISFPASWRSLLKPWRWLFFNSNEDSFYGQLSNKLNRGAYLVEVLGHCGECHTPRNMFGELKSARMFAGTRYGPAGQFIPNITADYDTGIGKWTEAELTYFLRTGLKPNGDDVTGDMREIIENSLRHLNDSDIRSMTLYLMQLKPDHNMVKVISKSKNTADKIEAWWD